MKNSKRNPERQPIAQSAPVPAGSLPWWLWPTLIVVALIAYLPALRGPFLFDDLNLPMMSPTLTDTYAGFFRRGLRALSNTSLLLDRHLWGENPAPYHAINWLLHCANAVLLFLCIRRLLDWAGREERPRHIAAAVCAGIFLLHPLQTEAVSYIASRSEVLCVFFSYLAYLVFLNNGAMSWPRAVSVLLLVGLGMISKEPAVALVPVLLLTDLFFRRNPIQNWKLYAPMILGGAVLGFRFYSIASKEGSAGASIAATPLDYLFTQFQAVWIYIRLFIIPIGQNLDHGWTIAKAPGGPLAWLGLIGLLAVLGAAWHYRQRFPLAALGALTFLVLLAPTSSILPIADPLVERRVYLASLGLLLILAELLTRVRLDQTRLAILAALCLVLAVFTFQRNGVYASTEAMWKDSLQANPNNYRAHFQLAYAYYAEGRCTEAAQQYQYAAQLRTPDYRLLVDYALALDCAGDQTQAIAKLRQATTLERNSHAWSVLGVIYGKSKQTDQALEALNQALTINPRDEAALVTRGNVHVLMKQPALAIADYDAALQINPSSQAALQGKAAAAGNQ